jgi:hypothetical protein
MNTVDCAPSLAPSELTAAQLAALYRDYVTVRDYVAAHAEHVVLAGAFVQKARSVTP